MPPQEPTPSGDFLPSTRQTMQNGMLLAQVWSYPCEAFLHHHFGPRYPGLVGWLAMAFIPLFTVFWGEHNIEPMLYFWYAYMALFAWHRFSALARWGREPGLHSYYDGKPWLWQFFPKLSEVRIKRTVEPLFLILVGLGLGLTGICHPLAVYLFGGGICLSASVSVVDMWEREQATNLNDALIQQRFIAERFRRMNGDGF